MRVTSARAFAVVPAVPTMPPGLVELMEGLARDVLRHNPENVYEFCANHMEKLLEMRDGPSSSKGLTLKEKISIAQDKVRQRAKDRQEKFDEEIKSVSTNSNQSAAIDNSDETGDKIIQENPVIPCIKLPIHHEHDLEHASEVEISLENGKKSSSSKENDSNPIITEPDVETSHISVLENPIVEILHDEKVEVDPISEEQILEKAIVTEPLIETQITLKNGEEVTATLQLPTITEISNDNSFSESPALPEVITEGEDESTSLNIHQNIIPEILLHETSDSDKEKSEELDSGRDENQNKCEDTLQVGNTLSNPVPTVESTSPKACVIEDDDHMKLAPTIDHNIDTISESVNENQGSINELSESPQINDTGNVSSVVIAEENTNIDNIDKNNQNDIHDDVDGHSDTVKVPETDNIESVISPEDHVTSEEGPQVLNKEDIDNVIETADESNQKGNETSDHLHKIEENITLLVTQEPMTENESSAEEKSVEESNKVDGNDILNIEKPIISDSNEKQVEQKDEEKEEEEIIEDNMNKDKNKSLDNSEIVLLHKSDSTDNTNENSLSNLESDVSKADDDSAQNPNMDLETAAVTIQKVFRSFMFKSRNSTFEDTANEENNSIDEDNDKKEEYYAAANLNKERRPLGITRMDTVLQTVNEEKSLSLSTDDSSTLSSAATTIQAHVRGFLVRSRLNSNKTVSMNSLVNSHEVLDADSEQQKNKTVLNIHIVPEEANYLSRDESLITSMDLSLDGSPPSSVNLHPLSYDISERRKMLKREDAVQSVTPPSNNSGKLSEDSLKEMSNENDDLDKISNDTKSNEVEPSKDIDNDASDIVSSDSTLTPTTVINVYRSEEAPQSPREYTETALQRYGRSLTKMSSDESDVVTPYVPSPRTPDNASKFVHSGEFHDVVLPTKVSRNDTSVVREFKNVLVYFLLWNNS